MERKVGRGVLDGSVGFPLANESAWNARLQLDGRSDAIGYVDDRCT